MAVASQEMPTLGAADDDETTPAIIPQPIEHFSQRGSALEHTRRKMLAPGLERADTDSLRLAPATKG